MPCLPRRILLLYWGRRGALSRLALELARASHSMPGLSVTMSVSRQNEIFPAFEASGTPLFPVTTFESVLGAAANIGQLRTLRRALADRIDGDRIEAVVALMPHVWSQLMIDAVHDAGARYVTVVHDAKHHPGDQSTRFHKWLLREAAAADHVITLSRTVADQLRAKGVVAPDRIVPAFLPDIDYGAVSAPRPECPFTPFRVLFFGRVLPYKGLPCLVDAIERLRASGVRVELSVYGEGSLRAVRRRLDALGAEVVNRWIGEDEIAGVFQRHHAVALSHSEASQSGVAAAAFGAGVPVVALPVGGIVEQVRHGETGLLARTADAAGLAESIAQLAADAGLHRRLSQNILRTRAERSPQRFLLQLASIACAPEGREPGRRSA